MIYVTHSLQTYKELGPDHFPFMILGMRAGTYHLALLHEIMQCQKFHFLYLTPMNDDMHLIVLVYLIRGCVYKSYQRKLSTL